MQQEEEKAIYNKRKVGEIVNLSEEIPKIDREDFELGFEDGRGLGRKKRIGDLGRDHVDNERLINLNVDGNMNNQDSELGLLNRVGSNYSHKGIMDIDLNLGSSVGGSSSSASLLSARDLHNKRVKICSFTLDWSSQIDCDISPISTMSVNGSIVLNSGKSSKGDETVDDKISVQAEDMVPTYLPDDVLYLVFLLLDQVDRCRALSVCRQWRAVGSHVDIWQKLNFVNTRITWQQFKVLCRRYPNVIALNLCDVSGLRPMKAISLLRNLEVLSLGKGMMIEKTFFEALNECSMLKNLTLNDVIFCNDNQEIVIDHERLCLLQIVKCGNWVSIRCPKLETLSLNQSTMSHVELNCPVLRSLDMSSCHTLLDSSICTAVTSCPLLESLNMAKCLLVTDATLCDIGLNCLNLHILDASYQKIYLQSVRLPKLTVLKLHGCVGITSASVEAISYSYALEILELDNCNFLTSVTLDLPRLTNIQLVNCQSFREINLQCNMLSSITVSGCPLLGTFNITSNSLKKLVLQNQEKLTTFSLECPSLQEVDLTECVALKNSVCEVFGDGHGCPMIKSLVLDKCEGLTDVCFCSSSLVVLSLEGCHAVKSLRFKCPLLEQVSLDGCDHIEKTIFDPVGLKSLDLGIFPKLDVINVEASHLESLELKGCGMLSEASINCPNLISLDASFCSYLKDDCLSATAASCPYIETLILMSCPSVSSNGLLALQWLPSLTYLDLSYTFLVDMQPIFKSCIHLKVLKVQACKHLVDWSLEPLYKDGALPALHELDLSYGTLSHLAMEELIACCTRLTHVSLNGCVNMHDLNWVSKADQLLGMIPSGARSPSDTISVDGVLLSNKQPTRMLQHLNCVGCPNINKVVIPREAECLNLLAFNLSLSEHLKEVDIACSNLSFLNLSNCRSLESLKFKCPKLLSLSLQSCNIEEEAIRDAISSCSMLETLDVRFCSKIYPRSMGKLRVACPSLKRIFNSLAANPMCIKIHV